MLNIMKVDRIQNTEWPENKISPLSKDQAEKTAPPDILDIMDAEPNPDNRIVAYWGYQRKRYGIMRYTFHGGECVGDVEQQYQALCMN